MSTEAIEYEPDVSNPHNERWVELFRYEDGSIAVRRSHELVPEPDHSDLLHQIERRLAELGCAEPSFVERLRWAELELAPIHAEAFAWLDEVGPSPVDDPEWDTDNWTGGDR